MARKTINRNGFGSINNHSSCITIYQLSNETINFDFGENEKTIKNKGSYQINPIITGLIPRIEFNPKTRKVEKVYDDFIQEYKLTLDSRLIEVDDDKKLKIEYINFIELNYENKKYYVIDDSSDKIPLIKINGVLFPLIKNEPFSLSGINTKIYCNKNESKQVFKLDTTNNTLSKQVSTKVHSSEEFQGRINNLDYELDTDLGIYTDSSDNDHLLNVKNIYHIDDLNNPATIGISLKNNGDNIYYPVLNQCNYKSLEKTDFYTLKIGRNSSDTTSLVFDNVPIVPYNDFFSQSIDQNL